MVDPPNYTQLCLELLLALPYVFQRLNSHYSFVVQGSPVDDP
jgi:hypothetical protein